MRRKPIDSDSLWELERVGSLSLAPDGSAAVCAVTAYSMEENKGRTSLWLLPTGSRAPRRLTTAGEKDGQPAWSPDGTRIAFLSRREQEGSKDSQRQLYVIPAAGGEAERKSDFGPGIEDFKWMPDGRRVVFVSWVWPDVKGPRAQAKRHKEFSERKESAYVTSEAQYRHWDSNLPMGRVPRLLMLDLESGRVDDLFEEGGHELPRMEPSSAHFDISPDGRRIAFVHDAKSRKRADNPLAIAELDLRTREVVPLTRDPAWHYDAPRYSPDGSEVACYAANVGFRHTVPNRIAFLRRGRSPRVVGLDWRIDPEGTMRWSADGSRIYFAAQERGRCHLWCYEMRRPGGDGADSRRPGRRNRVDGPGPKVAVQGGWVQGFDISRRTDDDIAVVAIDCARHPVQVHAVRAGSTKRLEDFNDEIVDGLALGETREVTLKGALRDKVQMFLTFPPGFNPKRKHPVLQVIHGGPYAAAGDTFGYRWNPHMLASRGHVVAAVNFHGSSGYGWRFHDAIMGRMGRLELIDIEAGTDWLKKRPWVDSRRIFASGGSYGGFMVAWMNGHVPKGRYRAYVCHAGVFDRVATFSADSFLHRPKDLGAYYWDDPKKVLAQSPCNFAHRMDTPTLIMHGCNDYRVPDQNGLAYYNTLVARGVPTRLVWYPDENHWILKPRNSRLWYREFHDWLAEHDLKGKRR